MSERPEIKPGQVWRLGCLCEVALTALQPDGFWECMITKSCIAESQTRLFLDPSVLTKLIRDVEPEPLRPEADEVATVTPSLVAAVMAAPVAPVRAFACNPPPIHQLPGCELPHLEGGEHAFPFHKFPCNWAKPEPPKPRREHDFSDPYAIDYRRRRLCATCGDHTWTLRKECPGPTDWRQRQDAQAHFMELREVSRPAIAVAPRFDWGALMGARWNGRAPR